MPQNFLKVRVSQDSKTGKKVIHEIEKKQNSNVSEYDECHISNLSQAPLPAVGTFDSRKKSVKAMDMRAKIPVVQTETSSEATNQMNTTKTQVYVRNTESSRLHSA